MPSRKATSGKTLSDTDDDHGPGLDRYDVAILSEL